MIWIMSVGNKYGQDGQDWVTRLKQNRIDICVDIRLRMSGATKAVLRKGRLIPAFKNLGMEYCDKSRLLGDYGKRGEKPSGFCEEDAKDLISEIRAATEHHRICLLTGKRRDPHAALVAQLITLKPTEMREI